MTNYKKNTNSLYALYQSGSEWRESASVKNTDLDDDGQFNVVERIKDIESQTSFIIYEPLVGDKYLIKGDDRITTSQISGCGILDYTPNEPITLTNTWNTCNWSITIDGETRTLKPTVCLTPFELYNITVWKEEAQANQWAKPVKLKERAIELGIWGYFTS